MSKGYGWDTADKMADEHSGGGGKFVRLANDGDKVCGIFVGEPYSREVIWSDAANGGKGGNIPFTESHAAAGEKSRLLVSFNFWDREVKELRVYEQGVTFYRDLLRFKEKYGLDNRYFEIVRNGKARDSNTTYSLFPDDEVDDATKAMIKGLKLLDLEAELEGSGTSDSGDTPAAASESATIGQNVIDDLVRRLKARPRADLTSFLERFGVAKIRDVKASDQGDAIAFVKDLETPEAAAKGGEVDPFE
jgi:hypothetical protein